MRNRAVYGIKGDPGHERIVHATARGPQIIPNTFSSPAEAAERFQHRAAMDLEHARKCLEDAEKTYARACQLFDEHRAGREALGGNDASE